MAKGIANKKAVISFYDAGYRIVAPFRSTLRAVIREMSIHVRTRYKATTIREWRK